MPSVFVRDISVNENSSSSRCYNSKTEFDSLVFTGCIECVRAVNVLSRQRVSTKIATQYFGSGLVFSVREIQNAVFVAAVYRTTEYWNP